MLSLLGSAYRAEEVIWTELKSSLRKTPLFCRFVHAFRLRIFHVLAIPFLEYHIGRLFRLFLWFHALNFSGDDTSIV